MSRYLSQYIPNESTITALLWELKKNADWKWTETHNVALQQLKTAITHILTISFYDVQKPVTIQCDAS